MEYHYMVSFNDQTKRWSIEDTSFVLPNGSVWSPKDEDWITTEADSLEDLIDQRGYQMVSVLATIWPAVDTTPMEGK